MNIHKAALIVVFLVKTAITNAQPGTKPFRPDGSLFKIDTSQAHNINQYIEATGNRMLGMEFLKDKPSTLVLYKPLVYQPVLIFAKDSVSAIQAVKLLSKERYLKSYDFSTDFRQLLKLEYTMEEITTFLGPPSSFDHDDETYNVLVYPGFTLKFIKSPDPKTTYLDSFVKYNFDGAKLSGLGIAGYGINLSDADNNYVIGFRGSFYNASKKRIKYLYITVTALNAVSDLVKKKVATAIGPIEPGDVGAYNYKDLFFSKIIETVRITSIKIQYFDGTVKLVSGPLLKKSFIESKNY